MGIFTNPVTVTVDTVDHTFSYDHQILDPKAIVGQWIEDTGTAQEESKAVIKHTENGTLNRRLLQRSVKLDPLVTGGERRRVTLNLTATYEDDVTSAEVEHEGKVLLALASEATFWAAFCKGSIS